MLAPTVQTQRWTRALTYVTILACPLRAVPFEGDVRATAEGGADSNVRRDYQQASPSPEADGFVSALLSARGRQDGIHALADGSYDFAARKFLSVSDEDVLIQAAAIEAAVVPEKTWAFGIQGRGKDRRGGSRSYTDLLGGAFLELFSSAAQVRLYVVGHRFLYRPFFPYSFSAIEGGLQAQYRLAPRHFLQAFSEMGLRYYSATAQPNPDLSPPPADSRREDNSLVVGVGYRYRGPFSFSVSYSYDHVASNSFGESIHRHRVGATAGIRLPWTVTLLMEGSLQFTEYPDGIYGSPDVVLVNDENLNSLSVKLLRPITDHLDLELQFATYYARLPGRDMNFTYWREVGGLGLTWRL